MASVVVAVGSNLGDRCEYLRQAGVFLEELSEGPAKKAAIWESEPVGPAEHHFLNSAALIETSLSPSNLLSELKNFERKLGRELNPKKWRARILDLDIISYNSLVIQNDSLIIPHPEYQNRLFVLLPMKELIPEWKDPVSGLLIDSIIDNAPGLDIKETDFIW